jgi:hypothetical protein
MDGLQTTLNTSTKYRGLLSKEPPAMLKRFFRQETHMHCMWKFLREETHLHHIKIVENRIQKLPTMK